MFSLYIIIITDFLTFLAHNKLLTTDLSFIEVLFILSAIFFTSAVCTSNTPLGNITKARNNLRKDQNGHRNMTDDNGGICGTGDAFLAPSQPKFKNVFQGATESSIICSLKPFGRQLTSNEN